MVKWNLEDIYKFEETDKLVKELKSEIKGFEGFREKLNEALSVEDFLNILKKKEELVRISTKLGSYAALWQTENTADSKRNAHEALISELCAQADNATLFFSVWFKDLDDKAAQKLIDGSGEYKYLLERMRAYKPYTLKEKEEQIINLKDLTGISAVVKLYDIITNKFKFEWEGKMISQEEINPFKQSFKRDERLKSYDLVLSRYGQEEEVLGEVYRNIVNDWKNESIKLRGFKSAISVRNQANDIPDKAVETLLNVVRRNAGVFQEYFKLKKKILGLDKFDRYDIYTPYKEVEKEYPYQECKKITLEVYKEFSNDAYNMAKEIFDKEHVHSELIENKRSGAFCSSVITSVAPYIMLNHMNKLNDLFTMMHEFGHGIHDRAASGQTEFTFHSSLPMAETASIFGEMLLSKRLLKEASKEEKIAVLVKMLDGQYASITRQAFFVIFEKDAHSKVSEGGTVDELNELYYKNLKEQFGDLIVSDVFKHEWKYIPHIHHTPFYCYAYAFGNLLVLALYKMYQEEGKDFVPKYMKILSYGGSKSPASILSEVGIDITSEEFWESGFEIIRGELEELKKLVRNS